MKTTRREFLGMLGCGAGLGLALPSLPANAAAAEPWRMRLATSSIQFKELTLAQTCQRVGQLGFEAIDIWDEFNGCTHLAEAEKLGPAGLKELLAKNGLKLSAFSLYRAGYPRYAELLGKLGGGLAVRGSLAGVAKPPGLRERMKKFLEGLKPEIELAEKHNSCLAIENHGNMLLNSLDSFKVFVELNASPRLGIALAPFHLQLAQISIPEVIRICGRQLFFFYAWQNAPEVGQLPGVGPADMKPWLAALAEIRYPHYVHPFMHKEPAPDVMAENLAKSFKYLKDLERQL